MRKIEEEMLGAIENHANFKKDNTEVVSYYEEDHDLPVSDVYLHGNHIARIRGRIPIIGAAGELHFTLAGWPTVTTRSRLHALGAGVYQRNNRQHSDKVHDGDRYALETKEWYTVTCEPLIHLIRG